MIRACNVCARLAKPRSLKPNLQTFSPATIVPVTLHYNQLLQFNSFNSCTTLFKRETHAIHEDAEEEEYEDIISEPKNNGPKFSSLQLSKPIEKALKTEFKYSTMTPVQHSVLTQLPITTDLLVRARTGTGKTLAFLLAALESLNPKRLTNISSSLHRPGFAKLLHETSILIISPTRELANQICDEARKLCTHHPFNVLGLVGGESRGKQLNLLRRKGGHIIVATPGRLLDLLDGTPEFAVSMRNLDVLVLDECDELLNMGFTRELQRIIKNYLPSEQMRQTFMFSATVSKQIRQSARDYLNNNHTIIDTITDEDQMNPMAPQSYILTPFSQFIQTTIEVINQHKSSNPKAKIIIFCPTNMLTIFYSTMLGKLLNNFNVLEIHSRLSQDGRSKVSHQFRKAAGNTILVSSDVSARGVDYPDVTLVLQLHSAKKESYVHRVGRTARAGKKGECITILSGYEKGMVETIREFNVQKNEKVIPQIAAETVIGVEEAVEQALQKVDAVELYTGVFSFMMALRAQLRVSKETMVSMANDFATDLLGIEVPVLSADVASRFGLKGIRGVAVAEQGWRRPDDYKPRDQDTRYGILKIKPKEKRPVVKRDENLGYVDKMVEAGLPNWKIKVFRKKAGLRVQDFKSGRGKVNKKRE